MNDDDFIETGDAVQATPNQPSFVNCDNCRNTRQCQVNLRCERMENSNKE